MDRSKAEPLRQVIAAEQIQKRVKELGRHISDDYQGQTIQALAVLEGKLKYNQGRFAALTGPDGPLTLLEAFDGRRPLIAYYFMRSLRQHAQALGEEAGGDAGAVPRSRSFEAWSCPTRGG